MGLKEPYETAFNMIVLQEFCKDCKKDPRNGDCKEKFCYENGVKIILEALEKQIPKKPIMRKDVAETYYICPECEWEVDKFDDNYCSDCGQKLDWGSEK